MSDEIQTSLNGLLRDVDAIKLSVLDLPLGNSLYFELDYSVEVDGAVGSGQTSRVWFFGTTMYIGSKRCEMSANKDLPHSDGLQASLDTLGSSEVP
jgi:hypothetical protein